MLLQAKKQQLPKSTMKYISANLGFVDSKCGKPTFRDTNCLQILNSRSKGGNAGWKVWIHVSCVGRGICTSMLALKIYFATLRFPIAESLMFPNYVESLESSVSSWPCTCAAYKRRHHQDVAKFGPAIPGTQACGIFRGEICSK
jgi:hypothetical protein